MSKLNKYNPSPWRINVEEDFWDENHRIVSVKDANNNTVCNNVDCYPTQLSIENMKLISIAPQMYELLPKIKWFLELYASLQTVTSGNSNPQVDELIEQIECLIMELSN